MAGLTHTELSMLDLLRSGGGFHSSAELTEKLGVTRAAMSKAVARLRDRGYGIESKASVGYALESLPDRLYPELIQHGLETQFAGQEIVWFEKTDSTNTQAARLADKGAAEGVLVVAESQSAGRGRLGRSWVSPAGLNFYGSFVLRPSLAPVAAAQVTLLSGLCVARSIEAVSGVRPRIKWPNDVLIGDRKVSGVLTESSSELDRINWIVLGIGVNLNVEKFPAELKDIATSVRIESGNRVDRAAFARRLCMELEAHYLRFVTQGFAPFRDDWERFARMAGEEVRVGTGTETVEGRSLGLDSDGFLQVETAERRVVRIVAGDVTLIRGQNRR
ncbi:MAG: biotin--[acetyl-CoA-carboxylase] ligase [Deltaproteobacteria bacterium]|nr:biotin--[acetyl-CoA-carboxylase] ligase [Deltaproteobacteria bacterium]